jgi:hypothetical protein
MAETLHKKAAGKHHGMTLGERAEAIESKLHRPYAEFKILSYVQKSLDKQQISKQYFLLPRTSVNTI